MNKFRLMVEQKMVGIARQNKCLQRVFNYRFNQLNLEKSL